MCGIIYDGDVCTVLIVFAGRPLDIIKPVLVTFRKSKEQG